MKITVTSVHARYGRLAVTLAEDFLNGEAGLRAQRIMQKYMMHFNEGQGKRAVFSVQDQGYDISAISTIDGLQAAMDAWANVPIELTFARKPVVRTFHENSPQMPEVHNLEELDAARAQGQRVQLHHVVRLNNFPALHQDTDAVQKIIKGGAYIRDAHVISMTSYLDIMGRPNDDPWVIAQEWEAAVPSLIV